MIHRSKLDVGSSCRINKLPGDLQSGQRVAVNAFQLVLISVSGGVADAGNHASCLRRYIYVARGASMIVTLIIRLSTREPRVKFVSPMINFKHQHQGSILNVNKF